MKVTLAALVALTVTSSMPSRADIDPEYRKLHIQLLVNAGVARRLTQEQSQLATSVAAHFVYIGPCMGKAGDLPGKTTESFSVMQWVMIADPRNDMDAAILEMIAIMTRESLGRQPDPRMCEFARGAATAFAP